MKLKDKNTKKMKESIHEKAIRLIEGGIVNVDGHFVKLCKEPYIFDPCFCCEMDSLCHFGTEMHLVCRECDQITHMDCLLVLACTKNETAPEICTIKHK